MRRDNKDLIQISLHDEGGKNKIYLIFVIIEHSRLLHHPLLSRIENPLTLREVICT